MTPCKFCDKEGTYSFGWLDSEGNWHDKHLICSDHAPISVAQQSFSCEMAQLRDKWKCINEQKSYLIIFGNP